MWDEIYDRLVELVEQHRSTLVFVNTRRLAERMSHQPRRTPGRRKCRRPSRQPVTQVAADRRKASSKKARSKFWWRPPRLSLESISARSISSVQISSPRAIAVALQRVGRSGHWRGAVPKGRFFATTRDELLECAALVRAIQQGDLDRIIIPESPLGYSGATDRGLCRRVRQARRQTCRRDPAARAATTVCFQTIWAEQRCPR